VPAAAPNLKSTSRVFSGTHAVARIHPHPQIIAPRHSDIDPCADADHAEDRAPLNVVHGLDIAVDTGNGLGRNLHHVARGGGALEDTVDFGNRAFVLDEMLAGLVIGSAPRRFRRRRPLPWDIIGRTRRMGNGLLMYTSFLRESCRAHVAPAW